MHPHLNFGPSPPPGVKRAHLLDARIDGGLLLELYSRDGVGTMISADFYEGGWPNGWPDGWPLGGSLMVCSDTSIPWPA